MKKIISLLLSVIFLMSIAAPLASAAAITYPDIPAGNWSETDVYAAQEIRVMLGNDDGTFGFGDNVRRGEFAAMLVRLFKWEEVSPQKASFSDVGLNTWYFSSVETALLHGAIDNTALFRPEEAISREEMAIMLVAALGYSKLAGTAGKYGTVFTDVSEQEGMIGLAYDFGIINGVTPTTFEPKGNAKREEAAAMMMRLYRKYYAEMDFSTAFYAMGSAGNMDMISDFSSICFGWGRLEYDGSAVTVGTKKDDSGWYTPSGYETPFAMAKNSSTPALLGVYLDMYQKVDGVSVAQAVLTDSALRQQAIAALCAEMNAKGYNGLCLDFEGFRGTAMKNAYSTFVTELSAKLKAAGKLLYVTVSPALYNQTYFDGYDYRALGTAADKVILMAYDYEATSLTDSDMARGNTLTPLTPFDQVYYSLKVFTDQKTGVPEGKGVFGLCFDSAQWEKKDGVVLNRTPYRPAYSAIASRLAQAGTTVTYHSLYRNPYATFTKEDGTEHTLWYENTESLSDKLALAKMFGVNGASTWTLGRIINSGASYGLDFPAFYQAELKVR